MAMNRLSKWVVRKLMPANSFWFPDKNPIFKHVYKGDGSIESIAFVALIQRLLEEGQNYLEVSVTDLHITGEDVGGWKLTLCQIEKDVSDEGTL